MKDTAIKGSVKKIIKGRLWPTCGKRIKDMCL